MFINSAWAQAAADAPKPAIWEQMFPFLIIFVVFYFFIIRPQSKQRKQHAETIKALKKGDQVIVIAGKEKGKQGTVLSVSNDRVMIR